MIATLIAAAIAAVCSVDHPCVCEAGVCSGGADNRGHGLSQVRPVPFCTTENRNPGSACATPNSAQRVTVEAEVCGADVNRPDLTVCIAGDDRRIRLFMPYPPCGTAEAKTAPKCAEWQIGRPW